MSSGALKGDGGVSGGAGGVAGLGKSCRDQRMRGNLGLPKPDTQLRSHPLSLNNLYHLLFFLNTLILSSKWCALDDQVCSTPCSRVIPLTVRVSCLYHGWLVHCWRRYWICENTIYSFTCCWCRVRSSAPHSLPLVLTNPNTSVGLLYLWSADAIRKGTNNGIEGALGTCSVDSAWSNVF